MTSKHNRVTTEPTLPHTKCAIGPKESQYLMTRMNRISLSKAGPWPTVALVALGTSLVSFAAPSFPGAPFGQERKTQGTDPDSASSVSPAASPAATAPSRAAAAPLSSVGKTGAQGTPPPSPQELPAPKPSTAPELIQEYASWKLEVLTRSSGSQARESLRKLRDRVRVTAEASPGEAGLVDLLTSIEVRLIIAMMGAGDTDGVAKALAALEAGAAPAAIANRTGAPGTSAPPSPVAKARRAALMTPEVRALIDSRTRQTSRAAAPQETLHSPADAAIDRYVRDAVSRGAADLIQQLGPRATPSLRDLSLAIDGQLPAPGSVDALATLMEIDPAQGLEVASQMAATKDILIKRRVAVALQNARPLEPASMWRLRPGRGDEPTSPHVTATLKGLMAEPSVKLSLLRDIAATLYRRGWIPGDLESAIPAILGTHLDGTKAPHVGSTSMLKSALKHTDPSVRGAAVRALRNVGDLTATYALASDPSLEVRLEVARSLGPWMTSRQLGSLPAAVDRTEVLPTVDTAYEKALLSIFSAGAPDSACEAAIRAALDLLKKDGARFISNETLNEAATVARAPQVIGLVMAYAALLDEGTTKSTADAVLLSLREAPPAVGGLGAASLLSPLASIEKPDVFWGSLTKAQTLGLISDSAAQEVLTHVRTAAFRHPLRMGEALAWLTERADPALWQRFYFAESAPPEVPEFIRDFTVGFGTRFLEPYVQAFGRIPGADPDQLMPMKVRRLSGAMAERMLEDRTMTPDARVWLVKTLIARGQHKVSDPAKTAEAILDAYVDAGQTVGTEGHLAHNGIDPVLFLTAALARPDLKDEVLLDVRIEVEAPELIEAVLQRFPPETWTKFGKRPLLKGAISGIMRSERPDRIELMKELVRVDQELAITVVEEIRCKGRPQDFELLEVVFEFVHPDTEAWSIALDAATNYLNDDAAGLLLELARRAYDRKDIRDEIMAAVEEIQNWQAAQRRFVDGLGVAAARAGAVKELIQILEAEGTSAEARAESLKGLGRLGAAEELPRLIRALSDPDPTIRDAARSGLEYLETSDRR